MSETKQKRSRKNPMTPILRDLRVAVSRIEKVRDGLRDFELHQASATSQMIANQIDSVAQSIATAWGRKAYEKTEKEILEAYRHPVDQPLPTINMEA